jgi:hypothetical protein
LLQLLVPRGGHGEASVFVGVGRAPTPALPVLEDRGEVVRG